jgi:hypothetical protein
VLVLRDGAVVPLAIGATQQLGSLTPAVAVSVESVSSAGGRRDEFARPAGVPLVGLSSPVTILRGLPGLARRMRMVVPMMVVVAGTLVVRRC